MSEMREWFFLRQGFNNFKLDPREHRGILLGDFDRQRRDQLITMLDGAARALNGQKTVIFGDYGRGKTHLCNNLRFEIQQRTLKLATTYIKCTEYQSKEKFTSFFRDMILGHDSDDICRIATEYANKVRDKKAKPLDEVMENEDIAKVMSEGLILPSATWRRKYMRWLGGDPKADVESIEDVNVTGPLTTGREFADVLRGLAQMYRVVDQSLLLYVVDEAERMEGVTHADTFITWKSAIREITEVNSVAMIFLVGAKTRNELPVVFVQPEIMRRIGTANYTELLNPSKEQLREFLLELFATLVRKGEAPVAHRAALSTEARSSEVPTDLRELVANDEARLQTYPFAPDALNEFLEHLGSAEFGNKPSEALERVQKAAQLAHTAGKRVIDAATVAAIEGEGL